VPTRPTSANATRASGAMAAEDSAAAPAGFGAVDAFATGFFAPFAICCIYIVNVETWEKTIATNGNYLSNANDKCKNLKTKFQYAASNSKLKQR
jgi:hypothetical protein